MDSPAKDFAEYFEDSAVSIGEIAATTGWSIHRSTVPAEPDTVIALFDAPGEGPDRADFGWEYPRLTITVRGSKGDYDTAYAKCREILEALDGQTNLTIGMTRYIEVYATSDIIFLSRDESNRPLFSLNFACERTLTT